MRRFSLPFHRLLSLAAIALLAAVLSYLGTVMYLDVRADIAGLMAVTDSTYLNSVSSEIGTAFGDVALTCRYLQQNRRLAESLAICEDERSGLYDKAVANELIRRLIAMARDNHPWISDVIIETPKSQYKIGVYSGEGVRLTLDGAAAGEIALHYPQGRNYFVDKGVRQTLRLSELAYYSFTLGEGPEAPAVYVILEEDYLRSAALSDPNILIYDQDGGCVYYDAERFDAARFDAGRFGESLSAPEAARSERGGWMVYRSVLPANGWTVLYLQDMGIYTRQYNFIILYCLLAMLATFALTSVLARLLSARVLRPLHSLMGKFRRYSPRRVAGEETREEEIQAPDVRRRLSNLRESIFFYLTATTVLPVAAFMLLFHFTAAGMLGEQTRRAYAMATENVARTLSSYLERKEKAAVRIAYDNETVKYFTQQPTDDRKVENVVRENLFFGVDDDAVDIYDKDGLLVWSNNMLAADHIFEEEPAWAFRWSTGRDALDQARVCLDNKIAVLGSARIYGYLRLSFRYETLRELLGSLTEDPVLLTDREGRTLTGGGQLDVYLKDTQEVQQPRGEKTAYSAKKVGSTPWYVCLAYETPEFSGLRVFRENGEVLFVALLAAVSLAYLLSHALLRPLGAVKRALSGLTPGSTDIRLDESHFIDEIGEIGRSFNEMADRLDDLIDDLFLSYRSRLRLEDEKRRAEMVALQTQINPHFLSNTIETISNIMTEGQTGRARDMLHALNDLFRYGISRPDYLITVREELQYARAYGDIMTVRYPNIRFTWRVDEAALPYRTVKLILQPVIENAIYHGLRGMEQGGVVDIRCDMEPDCVCFTVQDNGAGMEQERLSALRRDLKDAKLGSLIGIFNVQARIRLHFGESCGVEVDSADGYGTRVRIRIPKNARDPEPGAGERQWMD